MSEEEENIENSNAESVSPHDESISEDATSIENFALQQPVEQPETQFISPDILPLEIKNMEVHQHTHPGHHKKQWTDYFWEFLMLFLAVFCGFLAEYQLEHKIEADRVEKYMHDMTENLKYDTTRVAVNLPANREIKKDLDSFRYEIKEAIAGRAKTNKLYYYSIKINDYSEVAYNKSAITQLKNSGQLRLVKNDGLVNEILDYYERKLYASEIYDGQTNEAFKEFTKELNNVFSTTAFDFVTPLSDSTYSVQLDNDYNTSLSSVLNIQSLKLLTNDKNSLEKLHSAAMRLEVALIKYDKFLNYSRRGAEKLITEIKKEYQLKK